MSMHHCQVSKDLQLRANNNHMGNTNNNHMELFLVMGIKCPCHLMAKDMGKGTVMAT